MMKKNDQNLTSKKVSVRKMVLMTMLAVSTVFGANANNNIPADAAASIDVTPKGLVKNEMHFNLNFNNANGDKLNIRIVDEDGTNLYKEVFNGSKMNKTFRVNSEYTTVFLYIDNTVDKSQQKFVISNKEGEKVLITSVY